jgi:hypothetical protein
MVEFLERLDDDYHSELWLVLGPVQPYATQLQMT